MAGESTPGGTGAGPGPVIHTRQALPSSLPPSAAGSTTFGAPAPAWIFGATGPQSTTRSTPRRTIVHRVIRRPSGEIRAVQDDAQQAECQKWRTLRDRLIGEARKTIGNPDVDFVTLKEWDGKEWNSTEKPVFVNVALDEDPRKVYSRIQSAYAKMFLSNPDVFVWAGIAMYGSLGVGKGMDFARALTTEKGLLTPGKRDLIESIQKTAAMASPDVFISHLNSLYAGGFAIFEDQYWKHLAYQKYGLEGIRLLARCDLLSDDSKVNQAHLEAWDRIDKGRRLLEALHGEPGTTMTEEEIRQRGLDARKLIYEGNRKLFEIEQLHTVQRSTYDPIPRIWRLVTRTAPDFGFPPIVSPLPYVNQAPPKFKDSHNGSFADPIQRWDFLAKHVNDDFWRMIRDANHYQLVLQQALNVRDGLPLNAPRD